MKKTYISADYGSSIFRVVILLLVAFLPVGKGNGQGKSNFVDGREHAYCAVCKETLEQMPREVLFGIDINSNGEVYFLMNNREWFNRLFSKDAYGISADIISKDQYSCNREVEPPTGVTSGYVLSGVYRPALLKNLTELTSGTVYIKIGTLPASMKGKELEGNLIILNGGYICKYTNFVNIDRAVWELLPMGLFTDSLIRTVPESDEETRPQLAPLQKVQLLVPFAKGSSTVDKDFLDRYMDTAGYAGMVIRRAGIRAYASVEGPENSNKLLMRQRADQVIRLLKKSYPGIAVDEVVAAENWLDFFTDIQGGKFDEWNALSKLEIKRKLVDKQVASQLEPLLSRERKVILTLYLEQGTGFVNNTESALIEKYRKAITSVNLEEARLLQREIAQRIAGGQLPVEFLDRIEVPQSKVYSGILSDREVYKLLLKYTDEYAALQNFLAIRQLDPENGRLNYNICALRFFTWQYANDSSSRKLLLPEIDRLEKQGIPHVLVERMRINYYILRCEDQLAAFQYAAKDASLQMIRSIYSGISLNDEDLYSLAKYYAFYSHSEWAEEIIRPRIKDVTVSEDLVFYYVNLLLYRPDEYEGDDFRQAALNAINLNSKRFCNFFNSNDRGGASIQLLSYEAIRDLYCTECR